MTNRAMWAALALAAALAAGCTDSARAPTEVGGAAPGATASAAGEPVAPAATVEEPAAQAAPAARPIDDGSFRALAEEVAKLRAQLASMQKAAAAPKPHLIEPVKPEDVALDGEEAGGVEDDGPQPEIVEVYNETYVEREVPVYVEREVESEPTVILERVSYGDACCDQWIPCGHSHYIGCGHHYYGCSCHPWYYDLHSGDALNFSYVQKDTEVAVHRSGGGGGRRRNRDARPGLSGATATNGDAAAGTDAPAQSADPAAGPATSRPRQRRPSGRQRDSAPPALPATPAPAPALIEADTRVAFDAPEPDREPQAQRERSRGRNRNDDRAGRRNDRDDRPEAQPAAEEPRAPERGRGGRDDRPARAERDTPADHPQHGGRAQASREDPAPAPPSPRPSRQRKGD
jgi:hypothetical protein